MRFLTRRLTPVALRKTDTQHSLVLQMAVTEDRQGQKRMKKTLGSTGRQKEKGAVKIWMRMAGKSSGRTPSGKRRRQSEHEGGGIDILRKDWNDA